jgi:hypothetical protein
MRVVIVFALAAVACRVLLVKGAFAPRWRHHGTQTFGEFALFIGSWTFGVMALLAALLQAAGVPL